MAGDEPLKRELAKLGGELTKARRAAAKKLSPLIESQLGELGMEKATFSVSISPTGPDGDTSHALASGFDQVEFIVQTNPGQTPQPLRKIASGGFASWSAALHSTSRSHAATPAVSAREAAVASFAGRPATVVSATTVQKGPPATSVRSAPR